MKGHANRIFSGVPDIQNGLSPWTILLVTTAIVVAAVEFGYRVGRRQRRRPNHDTESLASALSTPAVGLVGLMLAFTFGWAATRFDSRRTTRVEEAQALGRVFRLADVLPPAERDTVRARVRDCIRTSLDMRDAASVERSFSYRAEVNENLWTIAAAAGRTNPTSLLVASFAASVNDVMDANLKRSVLVQGGRIPLTIVAGLGLVLAATMGMLGYDMGVSGSSRSPAIIPLTISTALVMFLIADLNLPYEGGIRVGTAALEKLQRELDASPSPASRNAP